MPGFAVESLAAVRTLAELGEVLQGLRRRDARVRDDRKASYRELAAKTGWSRTAVRDYITGQTLPSADRFETLSILSGAGPGRKSGSAGRRAGPGRGAAWGTAGLVRLGGPSVVGREDEVAGLRAAAKAAAAKAAAAGSGGVVVLCGDAGIGKTRLATEATRLAAETGLRVLRGRAATPSVQFRALSEALLAVVDYLVDNAPTEPFLLVCTARSQRGAVSEVDETAIRPRTALLAEANASLSTRSDPGDAGGLGASGGMAGSWKLSPAHRRRSRRYCRT